MLKSELENLRKRVDGGNGNSVVQRSGANQTFDLEERFRRLESNMKDQYSAPRAPD